VKIQQGHFVQLEYTLRNKDGETIETSAEDGPMEYVHGIGELPEAVEEALEGQVVGFATTITLPPGEAYGPYDPEQLISVPRDEFPADAEIVKGDLIELHIEPEEGEEGFDEEAELQTLEARVVDITPDAISLDTNHPLAGQEVTFEVRVLSIEESVEEEIE